MSVILDYTDASPDVARRAVSNASWTFIYQDGKLMRISQSAVNRIEGVRIRLWNADGSRTIVGIYMQDSQLYVVEGRSFSGTAPPIRFQ